jgi:hypothetical protein
MNILDIIHIIYMNYLHIIPYDIYILIYKYIYNDCMKELIFVIKNKRENKYKYKFIKNILNDENKIYYTSLSIFNMVSLGIISKNDKCEEIYYRNKTEELEELYYLSEININNFLQFHYNILITELPENFKDATCIKLKLSNIDVLLGFEEDNEDLVYFPIYYFLKDDLRSWLELIYYTNKLFTKFLLIHNLILNINFFTLYKFDTIIENSCIVIVPFFEEHIIN